MGSWVRLLTGGVWGGGCLGQALGPSPPAITGVPSVQVSDGAAQGRAAQQACGRHALAPVFDCRWDLGHLRSFLLRYFAHPPDFGARAGEAWPALVWRGLVCCGWGHG